MSRRIKLTIEYDGTTFLGWQRQKEGASIQGKIEDAIKNITGETVDTKTAGRTDKGVHALAQVCHFETKTDKPLIKFLDGINHYTPKTITITQVQEVTKDFHARYSATARTYEYLLYNRRQMSPKWQNRAGHARALLSFSLMEQALEYFPLQDADWSAFRTSLCQSPTPMVHLKTISLEQIENHIIRLRITANHFLHNMIRIIVGTLVEVGAGKRPPENIAELFINKNRTQAGATFSPSGLYLAHVDYKEYKILDQEPK